LIDRVEVKDPLTGQKYIFPCNKWLSKNKEVNKNIEESFLMKTGPSTPLP
jgi:hypothetical protein